MKFIYVPKTYFKLAKLDYLHSFYQKQQADMPNELALGGLYEVTSIDGDLYNLVPGKFKVTQEDLIPYEEGKYSFKVGDVVIFKPCCSEVEIKYLLLSHRFSIGREYIIRKVINFYYALLENGKGDISNPIRFSDIKNRGKR